MKKCKRCDNYKSINDFPNDKSRQDGKHPYCKLCRSQDNKKYIKENPEAREKRRRRSYEWKLKNPERYKQLIKKWKNDNQEHKAMLDRKSVLWSHYRLTIENYLEILDRQNGLCAICEKNKKLYVDHDHSCCPDKVTCGRCVRGLVCQKCNMMMHYIDECNDLLDKAIEYSIKAKSNV
jgi:hypothetical protein